MHIKLTLGLLGLLFSSYTRKHGKEEIKLVQTNHVPTELGVLNSICYKEKLRKNEISTGNRFVNFNKIIKTTEIMMGNNKEILLKANIAVSKGDYEGFLSFCTEDTIWTFVGEETLIGKAAVREYMLNAYIEPPTFQVDNLLADQDFVTAIGKISMKDKEGKILNYQYCDVWKFRDGKMAELKAFVIPIK